MKKLSMCVYAFLALSLLGCSGPKNNRILLRYSAWGGVEETKILEATADDFRKAHPDVDVRLLRIPWGDYNTKLLSQIAAGIAPDVLLVGSDQLPAFSSKGVFLDLKPYVDKDPSMKLDDFYPGAIAHFTVNGALTAIPRNLGPIALVYYNKKAFDEAGLPYPKNDWDYLEFLETAKKLTKRDAKGNFIQYGFIDEWTDSNSWVYAFGGSEVDNDEKPTRCTMDSPEAIAGTQFRLDLSFQFKVAPHPALLNAPDCQNRAPVIRIRSQDARCRHPRIQGDLFRFHQKGGEDD